MSVYEDRRHAGRVLASVLAPYAGRDDLVVLALPRGGVPVGYEVASRLGAPLDVLTVRKLGVPGHEEVAMGAIASGDIVVLDRPLIAALGLSTDDVERVMARERAELRRREAAFRTPGALPAAELRTVILVDDGLATGATMRAAVAAVRTRSPGRLVVAVPVAAVAACRELAGEVDEIACLVRPMLLGAVGRWYDDFAPVRDDEVRAFLARAARDQAERRQRAAARGGAQLRPSLRVTT